jgi:hypothetical protein
MWGGKWQPWQVEALNEKKIVDFILYTSVKMIKKDFWWIEQELKNSTKHRGDSRVG